MSAFVGCGGGGGGSKDAGKTFEGDGYSFAYPAEWAEQGGDTNTGRIDALVAPPQGGRNAVALTVVRHAVAKPVTDATIDQTVRDARPAVNAFLMRTGGVLESGPTRVTRSGLPGLRFRLSSAGLDPVVHIQATWLYVGTTAYTFNCQFLDSGTKSVMRACEQVLKSFQAK